MSKTLTRKQWNHAAADAARAAGAYSTVVAPAVWNTLDRSLTPAMAVARVLVALTPAEAPAAPVKAKPATTKARASKAPAAKAPVAGEPALETRIAVAVNMANQHAHNMDAHFGQSYCGGVRISVFVDGRTAEAKALRAAGFRRAGTGEYVDYVCGAQNLSANEAGARLLVTWLKTALPNASVYANSYGD